MDLNNFMFFINLFHRFYFLFFPVYNGLESGYSHFHADYYEYYELYIYYLFFADFTFFTFLSDTLRQNGAGKEGVFVILCGDASPAPSQRPEKET